MRTHAQALPYVNGLTTTQELYAFATSLGRNYAQGRSVDQLKAALRAYLARHHNDPLPAAADAILAQAGIAQPVVVQPVVVATPVVQNPPTQGQPPAVNQPPGPARAGYIWEFRPRRFRGGYHWVQVPDPAAPAPTPAPARNNDGVILALGAFMALAAVALLFLFVGYKTNWFGLNDDNGSSKVSTGLTADQQKILADAAAVLKAQADKAAADAAAAAANKGLKPGDVNVDLPNGIDHEAHLKALDPVFYSQGLEAWMKSAGMSFSSVSKRAQEPEQETFGPPKRTYVAAYQVATNSLNVPWPACLTTDQSVANYTAKYQPDPTKPSWLYTNVTGFTGNSTVYADCNAGEGLHLLTSGSVVTVPATGSVVKTVQDVKSLGTVIQTMGDTGVQLTLNQNISNLSGFVIQRDNANVTSASKGETVSIWKQ